MYTVELKNAAQKFIAAQSKKIQRQLIGRIESLAADPHPAGSKLLRADERIYSLRSGGYRILYQVENDRLTVLIIKIGHRREIYERLNL